MSAFEGKRVVNAYINRGNEDLGTRARIDSSDKNIVELVWVSDLYHISDTTLHSGCYIKRWYHFKPRLRLMTTNGVVETTDPYETKDI